MARVKLDLPEDFSFSTEVPIRISDINYGGHLGHDAILPLAHEARIKFLEHFGYSEVDIEGIAYLMADAVIIYKSQAYHGQTLKIEIDVRDFTRSACDFIYRLSDTETGTEIARLKTGVVFWDYRATKTARVPEGFKAKFSIG
jgi:acyl-CoA thioesterase FadM